MKRFWDKVNKTNGCWFWTGYQDKNGYGTFRINGTMRRAHRVSWGLYYNDPSPRGHVLHTCDTPSCVNPLHLILGTNQDNINDKMRKGRWRGGDRRGSNNGRSKITPEIVRQIRQDTRPARLITSVYGISYVQIDKIKRREAWRHIS